MFSKASLAVFTMREVARKEDLNTRVKRLVLQNIGYFL